MNLPLSPEPLSLGSLLAPGNEATVLSACERSPEPFETLLDLLLTALRARYVAWVDLSEGERRGIGRRQGGRPIPRPERLARGRLAEEVLGEERAVLRRPGGSGSPGWSLGFSICPSNGSLDGPPGSRPAAAFFAGSTSFPPPELGAGLPPFLAARIAHWLHLARALGDLRRENRALSAGTEPALASSSPGAIPAPDRRSPGTRARTPFPVPDGFPEIIAGGSAMREVLRTAALVAGSNAAILIEGESGTGKELIARAIHRKSSRAGSPFVSENCAACPEGLLESEFFGVERGAFTGAHRSKPGLFERAHRGTLFLDEIGEMDLPLQRKLLRALQEREVRRVGGSESIRVDFRLISATNRVLAEEARAGRFRPDLLYRVEVVAIRMPPLRERRDDIPPLIHHFLTRHSRGAGVARPPVDAAALRLLCEYSWPGNVRELENEMWRAVALGIPLICPTSLSAKILGGARRDPQSPEGLLRPGRSLVEIEREVLGGLIREVLKRTGGNKVRAAQVLGIPKTNLYRRLRRYAIFEFTKSLSKERERSG